MHVCNAVGLSHPSPGAHTAWCTQGIARSLRRDVQVGGERDTARLLPLQTSHTHSRVTRRSGFRVAASDYDSPHQATPPRRGHARSIAPRCSYSSQAANLQAGERGSGSCLRLLCLFVVYLFIHYNVLCFDVFVVGAPTRTRDGSPPSHTSPFSVYKTRYLSRRQIEVLTLPRTDPRNPMYTPARTHPHILGGAGQQRQRQHRAGSTTNIVLIQSPQRERATAGPAGRRRGRAWGGALPGHVH